MHPGFAKVHELAKTGRLDEALDLLHELADDDEPESLITLGNFYWQGGPVEQDPVRGRALFERAAAAGHPLAQTFHTNLLASGVFGTRDWPAALARLAVEARSNPERAQMLAALQSMNIDEDGGPRTMPRYESLCDELEVRIYRGLFSSDECRLVRAIAEPRYMRSVIHDAQGNEVPHPLRSSDGAPLHWLIEDPAIHALNRRLAAASNTLYDQAEPLLVLRYKPGQQYHRHFDALAGLDNQRIKTALVYLNEDYSGGETEFSRLGLKIKGRSGDVLVFANTDSSGQPHPLAEHAGLPVTSGTKYLGSRWIREHRHLP